MTTDAAVGGEAVSPDASGERWFLNDQREFLLRSIDDAEREYDAGDLAQEDYEVLVARDRNRLAEVEEALAALGPVIVEDPAPVAAEPAERRVRTRRGKWRLAGIVVSCVLIAVGAVILVNHAVNPALPGQASSGSITQSKEEQIEEQLQEAAILNNDGQAVDALKLYNTVLSEDPVDPEALAASGWLDWNYGSAGKSADLMRKGRAAEAKAIRLAPTYYAGHLFLGLILLNQDHNAPGAIKEFTSFLADSPPQAELDSVAPLVAAAYTQENQPLPAAIATAVTATTTTTSTP
jgi:tetratricopeptide (TPR) repeat protein